MKELMDTIGRIFAPVPPVSKPSFAIYFLKSSILSNGIPWTSTDNLVVKVIIPFPNNSAASAKHLCWAAVIFPFTVNTLAEKCKIEQVCPMHACKVVDKKITRDTNVCNNCGRCVGKCPFGVVDEGTYGYKIYVGGRWGKKISIGKPLSKIFTDLDEALNVIEKTILLYKNQGIKDERFEETIKRIGFENVEKQLFSDELLDKKEEILNQELATAK